MRNISGKRYLIIMGFAFSLVLSAFVGGQERFYDYEPDEYEAAIIDHVLEVKARQGGELRFIPRIALAIYWAADTLKEPFISSISEILSHAGGFHKVFYLGDHAP